MGFSSWNCISCGHSVRSQHSTNEHTAWMARAVSLINGKPTIGEYDGYGRINDEQLPFGETILYHEACWIADGRPITDTPSTYAEDQGFFIDPLLKNYPANPLLSKLSPPKSNSESTRELELLAAIESVIERITDFDRECEEAEYTDCDHVWMHFNAIKCELQKVTEELVPRREK